MANKVTWLHVSDFHFTSTTGYERNVLQDKLLECIKREYDSRKHRPDLIFVTGDIAQSGKESEYHRATEYFDKLLEATHCTRDRLFVVPGNHDVDQEVARYSPPTPDTMTDANRFFDSTHSSKQFDSFKAYQNWHDTFFTGIRKFPDNTACATPETLTINGIRLQILLINSALFSRDKNDKGKLWIIPKCLNDAVTTLSTSNPDLRIALLHHPFDWLHEAERLHIEGLLQKHVDIILRGHLHQTDAKQVTTGRGTALHLAAGAAYLGNDRPKKAMYCTAKCHKVKVYPICFHNTSQPAWTIDASEFPEKPDHTETFSLAKKAKPITHPKKPKASPDDAATTSTPVGSDIPSTDTELRKRLRETIDEYLNNPLLQRDLFIQSWEQAASNPKLSGLYEHCISADPLTVLWAIKFAIGRIKDSVDKPSTLTNPLKIELPIRMALVACEHLIKNKTKPSENRPKHCTIEFTMSDKIAAALVVAAWENLNIVLQIQADTNQIVIPHLINDFPIQTLGHENIRDVTDKEIKRHLDIRTGNIRSVSTDKFSAENIKRGLEVYEKETGMRFMVALDHQAVQSNLAELAEYLIDPFGIPLFRYNCPAEHLPFEEQKTWHKLQSDLLDHIEPILRAGHIKSSEPQNPDTNQQLPATGATQELPSVFVSYAHADELANEIIERFAALQRQNHLTLWYDGHINTGEEWETEILKKICFCHVAVLLISTNFLNSEFIQKTEVPMLLKKKETAGILLLPVLIESADWESAEWLSKLQMMFTKEGGLSDDHCVRKKQLTEMSRSIREQIQQHYPS